MIKSTIAFFKVVLYTLLIVVNGYSQISFEENSSVYGVSSTYGSGEFGGGVSFYDYNNDGWDDLTIATEFTSSILFFKNINGSFVVDNISIPNDSGEAKQVQWVDFDNDGDNDLFISNRFGPNYLYENDGSFSFTDITVDAGLDLTETNSWGASWGDINNDGFLDLFISFRKFTDTQPNALFKNNGDGTFTNISAIAGINQVNDPSFCAAFFDYDNDGWQDIFVTNHKFSQSYLYKNNGDETFTDVSEVSGADIISDGMSTTIGDYNNDGWFDIYITNIQQGNFLLKNNGDSTFTNVAEFSATKFNSIAWGSVFLDADNDKDLDLYVSGMLDGTTDLPSAFYENLNDGTFEIPINAGFTDDVAQSFSNAIGDFNNDGLPDIFVVNQITNNYLWENTTDNSNNWLKVNLTGVNSNRDGIGSRIEISVNGVSQYRYTLNGEGYIAQNSKTEFFGVGTATNIDYVKVTWLGGAVDVIYNTPVNQTLSMIEGESSLLVTENSFNNFVIYPNPTSNFISIKSNGRTENQNLRIFDLLGKKVDTFDLTNSILKIDVSQYNRGIYLFKITSLSGVTVKKVVLY